MKETRNLYDKDRKMLDITNVRGEPIPKDTYILAVHVVIFNLQGQMLIQKRASSVNKFSDMWDFTAGGCAIVGESSQRAAEREVQEELGLFIDLVDHKKKNIRPDFTINYAEGFDDFYVITRNIDIRNIVLQKSEVQDVLWANVQDVQRMWAEGLFVPYKKGLIDLIVGMEGSSGSLI